MKEKAILVVSFGSSYEETRKRTITQIEEDIKNAYPSYSIYSAFTSGRIIKKIAREEGKQVLSVEDAMEQMLEDGIKEVFIQPTFIVDGVQNKELIERVEEYKGSFQGLRFGTPLLTSIQDYKRVINVFVKEHEDISREEAVICMGHGADEYLSVSFAALDYMFKEEGYENYYVATIRSYPSLDHVIKALKKHNYKKVTLIPFMVVAGYHAQKDLLGKAEEAWRCVLEKEGYEVTSILKGLGEYKEIRAIYIDHTKDLLKV